MPNIFSSIMGDNITFSVYMICTAVAFLCGNLVAAVSSYKNNASKSFILSLVILPAVIETVIIMVNGNVGTGIAVAGAFSLVRFRSVPGKAKEIAAIFLVMTAGLSCAAGYIGIAIVFTVIVSAAVIIVMRIPMREEREMCLHMTVPESLQFTDAFNDIFDKYTSSCSLVSAKTTNMGSLYKLVYKIELNSKEKMREFIDELRCRNGNLEIMITDVMERGESL